MQEEVSILIALLGISLRVLKLFEIEFVCA